MCWRKQWKVRRERVAVYVRSLSRARARDRWVLLVSEPWGMLRKALGRRKGSTRSRRPDGVWMSSREKGAPIWQWEQHKMNETGTSRVCLGVMRRLVWLKEKSLMLRWQGKQEKLCRLWRTLDNGWERFFSYVQWGGDCWEHSRCTAWL